MAVIIVQGTFSGQGESLMFSQVLYSVSVAANGFARRGS